MLMTGTTVKTDHGIIFISRMTASEIDSALTGGDVFIVLTSPSSQMTRSLSTDLPRPGLRRLTRALRRRRPASSASPSAPAPSSRCSAGLGGSRRRSTVPPAPQAQVNVNKVRNALVANRSVFKLILTERQKGKDLRTAGIARVGFRN